MYAPSGKCGYNTVRYKIVNNQEVAIKTFKTEKKCKMIYDIYLRLNKLKIDNILMPKTRISALELEFPRVGKDIHEITDLTDIEKQKIITVVLNFLVQLHSHKFIHGDIKKENVVYDRNTGRIAVIDMETVVYMGNKHRIRRRSGTKSVYALEQHFHYETYQTDVWHFGVLVAEMNNCCNFWYCLDIYDIYVLNEVIENEIHNINDKYVDKERLRRFKHYYHSLTKNIKYVIQSNKLLTEKLDCILKADMKLRPMISEVKTIFDDYISH